MAEEELTELSAADERFCFEYVYSENKVRSYMKARPGVQYNSAAACASRLLKNAKIKQRIKELQKARAKKLERSADKVLARLEARANFNPRDVYDDDGKLIPLKDLDPDLALGIKSITTKRYIEGKGENAETVEMLNVTFFDGKASDELLGRNLNLWKDVGSKDNPLHVVPVEVVFGDDDD